MIKFLKSLFVRNNAEDEYLDEEFKQLIKRSEEFVSENTKGETMAILYVLAQYTTQSEVFADFLSPEYLLELEHSVSLEYENIHPNIYNLFIQSKAGYFHKTTPDKVKELNDNLRN